MHWRRGWLGKVAVTCLCGLAWAATARAQSQAGAASFGWGLGYMPQMNSGGTPVGSSNFGMMPVPLIMPGGGASSAASARAADPLGLGYVYGPAAIPMTPGQAGLYMLSTTSRMTGLGNGQLSGVRSRAPRDSQAARTRRAKAEPLAAAAHTRDSNIPGGQAARFFNRGSAPAASRSRPYYQRSLRYFPKNGQ